jgi:hypothetical protein
MKLQYIASMVIASASIFVVGISLAAQDKYTVQVPNGLAFSEFRGYEDWQAVAVSQTLDADDPHLKMMLANPVMIDAYRTGIPGNGKPFPEGSKIAKVEWKLKENAESPFPVNVPDTLVAIGFMVKDSKRFPDSDSGGWGYAQFSHDPASDTYSADERYVGDARCGVACHAIVAAKDYVFTAYGRR